MRAAIFARDFWQDLWFGFFFVYIVAGIFIGQGVVIGFGVMGLLAGTVSLMWKRVALEEVFYERSFPNDHAFIGDEVPVTVSLTNRKPVPVAWIRVEDEYPEALTLVGGDVNWNAFAKVQVLRHSTSMAWYERIRWNYSLRCTRRGLFRIGPARVESGDPFGFHRTLRQDTRSDYLLVYPRIYPLHELGIPAERPLGEVRGGNRMFQDPSRPSGLREYQRGDPLNTVDWKATARTQRLHVRVFDPSSAFTVILCVGVDTTARYWRPDFPEIVERVIVAAASMAAYAADKDYVLGLFSNDIPAVAGRSMTVPAARGREQLAQVLGALASIRSFAVGPMADHLAEHSRRFPIGSTVVLVASFVPPELVNVLSDLKDRGYKLVVLYVGEGHCPDMAEGVLVNEMWDHFIKVEAASEFGPR